MAWRNNRVQIIRGSGESTGSGSRRLQARYGGKDVTLIVIAAVIDSLRVSDSEEWSDGVYAFLEGAASRKLKAGTVAAGTLTIEISDLE